MAAPSEYVSTADSPTPRIVRDRLDGMVATVCEVMVALVQGQGCVALLQGWALAAAGVELPVDDARVLVEFGGEGLFLLM
ncbi:MAG: hypothetical protein EHM38_07775 [Geobacteraceae bacterium]|nr:MAG: hypothetical protein EHM38_07775 [Geobacteraceae bacterium]